MELPVLSRLEQSVLVEPDTEEYLRVAKSKILVIDDELVVRDFISQVLTNEGHEVEAIDNAEDALKMIKDKRYSLILLDIKMPGMSGIELYNHLQQNSRSLISKIIFITGDLIGTDTLDFLSKSKAPYITKPIDAEQLKRSINPLLTKST